MKRSRSEKKRGKRERERKRGRERDGAQRPHHSVIGGPTVRLHWAGGSAGGLPRNEER